MPSTLVQRAFAAGELAPSYGARADIAAYLNALRTCRNFIVQRQGGVANRPGTKFVAEVKTSANETFLFPFIFGAADQSYVIEAGASYFRFFHRGARVVVPSATAWSGATAYVVGDLASRLGVIYYCTAAHTNQQPPNAAFWHPLPVVNGANVYEIPTPYATVGIFKPPAPVGWEQSGDVVTITHLNHAPMELRRFSSTRWTLSTITTAPSIAAPTGGSGVAGAAGARTFQYVVTAAAAETYEESLPSAVITVVGADPTTAAPHALAWTAVAGAAEYYVYGDPNGNGTFGFLGVATGVATFRDIGFVPDFAQTPPVARTLFASTNNYPGVAVVYQQRRIFAGTHVNRELVQASQVGFYSNFGVRSPLQDDDAVSFSLAGKHIHPVHHLVGLRVGLVVLTDGGEWCIEGDEQGALLPRAINARQHGWAGSAFTSPVVIGESILFVQGRGTVLRDLRFDERFEGLSGRDLSRLSAHLFDGFSITDMAYAQVPHSIVWCVRSDGALLGLTYIRDEDVWGWHRHDTDGTFEQVVVIPEDTEDAVYVLVKRTVGGATKRYIERFASRAFATLADAFFVDCGLSYSGGAATTITGLSHLAGSTVNALADGVVRTGLVVSAGGSITLPAAASKVQVGLSYTAELETLDLDVAGTSVRDKRKRVAAMALLIEASSRGFLVGPDASALVALRAETWETTGVTVTGQVEVNIASRFTEAGRTLIRQTEPVPLTVLALMPHVEVGG